MKALSRILILFALCIAAPAYAADPQLRITESTLNRMLSHIGTLADGGVAQLYSVHEQDPLLEICYPIGVMNCPGLDMPGLGVDLGQIPLVACTKYGGGVNALPTGEPVSWQWWVSNAYLTVSANGMTFTATVLTRVGEKWAEETRTVDATIVFEQASNNLRLDIDDFKVTLATESAATRLDAGPVDVSGMYAITMAVPPQNFAVPMPVGPDRNINARLLAATSAYAPNVVTVTFDVAF